MTIRFQPLPRPPRPRFPGGAPGMPNHVPTGNTPGTMPGLPSSNPNTQPTPRPPLTGTPMAANPLHHTFDPSAHQAYWAQHGWTYQAPSSYHPVGSWTHTSGTTVPGNLTGPNPGQDTGPGRPNAPRPPAGGPDNSPWANHPKWWDSIPDAWKNTSDPFAVQSLQNIQDAAAQYQANGMSPQAALRYATMQATSGANATNYSLAGYPGTGFERYQARNAGTFNIDNFTPESAAAVLNNPAAGRILAGLTDDQMNQLRQLAGMPAPAAPAQAATFGSTPAAPASAPAAATPAAQTAADTVKQTASQGFTTPQGAIAGGLDPTKELGYWASQGWNYNPATTQWTQNSPASGANPAANAPYRGAGANGAGQMPLDPAYEAARRAAEYNLSATLGAVGPQEAALGAQQNLDLTRLNTDYGQSKQQLMDTLAGRGTLESSQYGTGLGDLATANQRSRQDLTANYMQNLQQLELAASGAYGQYMQDLATAALNSAQTQSQSKYGVYPHVGRGRPRPRRGR